VVISAFIARNEPRRLCLEKNVTASLLVPRHAAPLKNLTKTVTELRRSCRFNFFRFRIIHRMKNVGEDYGKISIRTQCTLVYLPSQLLLQSLESDFHMIKTLTSVSCGRYEVYLSECYPWSLRSFKSFPICMATIDAGSDQKLHVNGFVQFFL